MTLNLNLSPRTLMVAVGVVAAQFLIILVFVLGTSREESGLEVQGDEGGTVDTGAEVLYDNLQEDFVANPIGTRGLRAVSARFSLVLASPQVAADIEMRKLRSLLNDEVQAVLSSRTVDDLTPPNWPRLKEEIRDKLNHALGPGAVREVLIGRLVLQ